MSWNLIFEKHKSGCLLDRISKWLLSDIGWGRGRTPNDLVPGKKPPSKVIVHIMSAAVVISTLQAMPFPRLLKDLSEAILK